MLNSLKKRGQLLVRLEDFKRPDFWANNVVFQASEIDRLTDLKHSYLTIINGKTTDERYFVCRSDMYNIVLGDQNGAPARPICVTTESFYQNQSNPDKELSSHCEYLDPSLREDGMHESDIHQSNVFFRQNDKEETCGQNDKENEDRYYEEEEEER